MAYTMSVQELKQRLEKEASHFCLMSENHTNIP